MPGASTDNSAVLPVYAVCGGEPFLKRQAMERITREVLGNADRSLALSEYDGTGPVELAGVLDDLRTLPFLTERRLVVVREADKFITAYREALEDYAAKPSPTGVLLIECKSMPGNTRLA
ncbi:MAG: DNA polymerase III subunit delta, partial [Planctomycetes bacterium]|nr:DNA polymerase III subunit delta [Planctomycetota bacterium]